MMELRLLEYFLAVAREQSINKAAESLHMTQPSLSRQMQELEKELGRQLFIRSSRKITLTEEGMIFRKRAEEMLDLIEKAKTEVLSASVDLSGEIFIGSGETRGISALAGLLHSFSAEYPHVKYHLYSGNAEDICDRLDRGLLDFGLIIGQADVGKYQVLPLPGKDRWGLLLRRDHPLAGKEAVRAEDLPGLPLLLSRQMQHNQELRHWFGRNWDQLEGIATYNLLYNASLLAEAGVGCVLCLENIIPEYPGSLLRFLPLDPPAEASCCLIWKKSQVFSRPAKKLLERLKESFSHD